MIPKLRFRVQKWSHEGLFLGVVGVVLGGGLAPDAPKHPPRSLIAFKGPRKHSQGTRRDVLGYRHNPLAVPQRLEMIAEEPLGIPFALE